MKMFVVAAALVMLAGCKLAPDAKDVGLDEAFVSSNIKISEDEFTKTRTYTGPEFMSKESTLGTSASWVSMDRVETLDRSSHAYRLVVRTYHDRGNLGHYNEAYDDTGAKMKVVQIKVLSLKEELCVVEVSPEDISRIIGRNDNTRIKLIGENGSTILLLPRSYVVDFTAATR